MSEDSWFVRDRDRIRGPYTQEQLIKLHQRGQLARFHDISTDRQNWVKARTLLDPIVSEPPTADPQLSADWPSSSQEILTSSSSSSSAWPETNIDSLLGERPRREASRWRWIIAIAFPCIFFATGFLLLSFLYPSRSLFPSGPEIRSLENLEVSGAVGLVVVGVEQTLPDGTHGDIVLWAGTCFAISEDGYFLTNRHIVEVHDRMQNAADLDQKKRIYIEKLVERNRAFKDEIDGELEKFPDEDAVAKKNEILKGLADRLVVSKLDSKIWIFPIGKDHQIPKYEVEINRIDVDGLDVSILKVKPNAVKPEQRRFFRISEDVEKVVPKNSPVFTCGISGEIPDASSANGMLEEYLHKTQTSPVDSVISGSGIFCVRKNGKVNSLGWDKPTASQLIHHSAWLTPLESGGPLVTSTGLVVGINAWMASDGPNNYRAIAMTQLKEIIKQNATKVVFETN